MEKLEFLSSQETRDFSRDFRNCRTVETARERGLTLIKTHLPGTKSDSLTITF